MSNENKKTIENLKNEEIDGQNTVGGTSINTATPYSGSNTVPVDLGGGTGFSGPGQSVNPIGIGNVDQTNPSADIKPLDDYSSDSLSSSGMDTSNS